MTKTSPDDDRLPVANEHGVEVRPALEVLSRMRGGRVLDLLALELNEVVRAVKDSESGKAGKVTLTIDIKPIKKIPDAVELVGTITGKAPKDPPPSDLMFADDDGNLHTRNPRQGDLLDRKPRPV